MDKAYLMVLVAPETWKKIFKGKYDECMERTLELDDTESWMIVRPSREHFGVERFTITN